jgi:hypothetical protein
MRAKNSLMRAKKVLMRAKIGHNEGENSLIEGEK